MLTLWIIAGLSFLILEANSVIVPAVVWTIWNWGLALVLILIVTGVACKLYVELNK